MSLNNSKNFRVGFIGAGNVTKRHVDAIGRRSDTTVVAVADPMLDSAKRLAEPYGADTSESGDTILERSDIDVVYICTPHHLHHPYALRALRAGKHVFIEKPMANTVEECEQINQAAKENGLTVGIGHHQRYFPHMKRFRELLQDGAIGELRQINDRLVVDNQWSKRAQWWKQKSTAGGGGLMNIGVHQIDRCLWLVGQLPTNVYARVRCGIPEFDVDTDYIIVLGMPDRSTVNLHNSSYPCKMDFSIEALGTTGRLMVDPVQEKLYLSRSGEDIVEEHVPGFTEAVEELTTHFVSALKGDPGIEVDGAWGETVLRIAQAAYRSSEEGASIDFSRSQNGAQSVPSAIPAAR